jgi:hypothetical protein
MNRNCDRALVRGLPDTVAETVAFSATVAGCVQSNQHFSERKYSVQREMRPFL